MFVSLDYVKLTGREQHTNLSFTSFQKHFMLIVMNNEDKIRIEKNYIWI